MTDLPWSADQIEALRCSEAKRSLHFFVRLMWRAVEPKRKFVDGWALRTMCEHLEAVAQGRIRRLIINVPPGSMKSLLTNVFFPAWMWGPLNLPHKRFFTASYSASLTERDNERMRMLVSAPEFQTRWGHQFRAGDNKIKFANDKTGWKIASSVEGTTTGERGDVVIIDDPNDIQKTESPVTRERVQRWLNEVMPTRLNDPERSAIILIQQRTNEEDATGTVLDPERGGDEWCYLMIPMEYDPDWTCGETFIGWTDPRAHQAAEDVMRARSEARRAGMKEVDVAMAGDAAGRGQLMWPERFPQEVVDGLKKRLGNYAWAGQMQQHPKPRGGAIIKDEWWKLYGRADEDPVVAKMRFPAFDYVVASLDSALTDNKTNDPSALVILATWTVPQTGRQAVMMVNAWQDHLQLNPLVKRVAATCDKYRVSTLLIENKANGHDVNSEIKRMYVDADWSTQLVDPTMAGAKVARVNSITHLFEEGMIWHPNTAWAQMVIDQCGVFPRGAHDDLVDALSQGLRHLRERGILYRRQETKLYEESLASLARSQVVPRPLYPT
jgi:predicted phage terminase large subunit-like protein